MVHHLTCQEKGISISIKGVRDRKESAIFLSCPFFFMLKCIYSFFFMILSNKDHSDNCGIIWPWELLFKYFCLPFFTTQSSMHFSSLFLLHPKINQSTHVSFIANRGFLYGEVDLWWGSHLHFKGTGYWNHMWVNRILAIQSISWPHSLYPFF